MKPFFDLLAGLLQGIVKVALLLLATLFALGVLVVALLVIAGALIRFLLTGRKPAVFATFSSVRASAASFRSGTWSSSGGPGGIGPGARGGDVVDVTAHEVRPVFNNPALPPKRGE